MECYSPSSGGLDMVVSCPYSDAFSCVYDALELSYICLFSTRTYCFPNEESVTYDTTESDPVSLKAFRRLSVVDFFPSWKGWARLRLSLRMTPGDRLGAICYREITGGT